MSDVSWPDTPLTRDQVVELLQVAATYDRRTIGDTDVVAWAHAAREGRWATWVQAATGEGVWSNHRAVEAIRHHYATSTAYLMPGHVTERIRQVRRHPDQFQALPPAEPAGRDRVARLIEAIAAKLSWPRPTAAAEDVDSLSVECPHCQALPGTRCGRRLTRGPRAGEWVTNSKPHPSRVEMAATAEGAA